LYTLVGDYQQFRVTHVTIFPGKSGFEFTKSA